VIGSLLRITSIVEEFLTLMLKFVLEGVGWWKHLLIYFYIVICLVLFGAISLGGLVFQRLYLQTWHVTLLNSVFLVVLLSRGVHFYTLFGLQLCGKYRKKEITEVLIQKSAQ